MDRVAVSGTPPSLSFGSSRPAGDKPFSSHVGSFFETEHARVFAYVQRLSGEPDLAADIAQDDVAPVALDLFRREHVSYLCHRRATFHLLRHART